MNFREINNLDELIKRAERDIEDVIEYFMSNFKEDVELTNCTGVYTPGRPATREDPPEYDEIELDVTGILESKLLKDDLEFLVKYYTPKAEKHMINLVEKRLSNPSNKIYRNLIEKQEDIISDILVNSTDIEHKNVAAIIFFLKEIMTGPDTSNDIANAIASAIRSDCTISSGYHKRRSSLKTGSDEDEIYEPRDDKDDDRFDIYERYGDDYIDYSDMIESEADIYAKDIVTNPIKLVTFELIDDMNYLVKWEI
jgi:hypothetical protein